MMMMMMMLMMMLRMMMMTTIVSVEQRPSWGDHVKSQVFVGLSSGKT
jgi:hypothetical protein